MLDFPLWKRIALWAVTLLFALAALPSVASLSGVNLPDWAEGPEVNLGLDLAGGSHILLEADPSQVAAQRLETMEEAVREELRTAEPRIRIGDVSTANERLSFILEDPSEIDRVREILTPLMNGNGIISEWNLAVLDGNRVVLTQTEDGLDQAVSDAMDSATDVVRRRIDDLGTREPTIIRQGDNRIVVQVPGLEDPQQLKDLLGQTARLEFKLVDANALPSDIAQGIVNPGSGAALPRMCNELCYTLSVAGALDAFVRSPDVRPVVPKAAVPPSDAVYFSLLEQEAEVEPKELLSQSSQITSVAKNAALGAHLIKELSKWEEAKDAGQQRSHAV